MSKTIKYQESPELQELRLVHEAIGRTIVKFFKLEVELRTGKSIHELTAKEQDKYVTEIVEEMMKGETDDL